MYARLVGPFEVIGLETPDGERSPLLHEALALLLLHREGVHPRVLSSALWPRGVTDDVRDALVERLRDWLGTDPDGTPRLAVDAHRAAHARHVGRLRLDVLRSLYHEATEGQGRQQPCGARAAAHRRARAGTRPLLADRAQGRYGWLTHEIIDAQLPLLVADIGLALSAFHLDANKPKAAVAAVETGMAVSPNDERLWLAYLRASHATGDSAGSKRAANTLIARSHEINGPGRGLPPRVEALLDELLPAWRGTIAN